MSNSFWRDALYYWSEYKQLDCHNTDTRAFPIWGSFSKPMRTSSKEKIISFFLVSRGVVYVNDLLSKKGDFFGFQIFYECYGIEFNFVDYYSLKKCIPREWTIYCTSKLGHNEVKQLV